MKKIEVKNLTYGYSSEKNVLENMSFSIESGKYVSILGHNGSGKSTISKLLLGLLTPQNGEIYIDGELLTEKNVTKIRQKMALVFQNPDNQFVGATVEDDVAFGLENRQVPQEKMEEIIEKYLKLVGMNEFRTKEPSNLSGGQKQRVAIASALALSPEILILDEATSMLDPKGKREINQLIRDLKKDNPELTIIAITHDINEALLSDEILIVSSGGAYPCGTPEETFSNTKLIEENNLSIPFIINVKSKLSKMGYDTLSAKNIDDLVEAICR